MKKKLMKRLLSVILVATLGLTQMPLGNLSAVEEVYAEGTNLLDNGDFEKNEMTSWNFTVEQTIAQKEGYKL